MDLVASPTSIEASEAEPLTDSSANVNALHQSKTVPVDHRAGSSSEVAKPPLLTHVSTPAYSSPLRHHRRTPSTPHKVKESLNARSEYVTSQDDGVAEHRINQYIIKQEIGRGSFGAVHLAVDQYGKEYAVKEFSKSRLRKRAQSHILRKPIGKRRRGGLQDFNSPLHRRSPGEQGEQPGNSLDLIKEEIAIMKKLHHPNLVSLIEVLDDPSEDSLYMVMEMCKKGVVMRVGLDQQADPYPDDTCRCWFRDLILGIEYLHAQGVVHRDIKPDNCLITEDDILKVVDFGVSEMFEKDSAMLTAKSAGSPAFLPPELCVVKHGDVSGKAADIWSMGVTLYCLKFGQIPFHKDQIFELYEAIKTDHPDFGKDSDSNFHDLMARILEKDPTKRITMSELRQHPWVTQNGSDPLLSEMENTALVLEPPTQAEVEAAITDKMNNLMTVVKAVRKFKNLTAHKRPPVMQSILGDASAHNFSQPPGPMRPQKPPLKHTDLSSQSLNTDDRYPIEGALATEGVHRKIDTDIDDPRPAFGPSSSNLQSGKFNSRLPAHIAEGDEDSGLNSPGMSTPSEDLTEPHKLPFRSTLHHAHTADEAGNRGHAHDPLEDQLYLRIGPSTFAGPSSSEYGSEGFTSDEVYVVSESPGAADVDIYETAYRDEIERILARAKEQDKEPQVYLTRRVDAKLLQLSGLAGKLMAHGEEAKTQFKDYTQFSARKARVTEVSKALREVAHAEYEKRRQEHKGLIEAAKAEKAKATNLTSSSSYVDSTNRTGPDLPDGSSPPPGDSPSSRAFWKAKAADHGRQAKTSVKGLVGLVKQKSRSISKDDLLG